LTPLVGRDEEIELLLRRWQRAKSGSGQVVLISGEMGIGKSRLIAKLFDEIATEPQLTCGISARRIIRTAHSSLTSVNSNALPGSSSMTIRY